MTLRRALPLLLPVASFVAMPALARGPDPWGRPFGADPFGSRWDGPRARDRIGSASDSREGKVDADSFVAQDAQARLGHGRIALSDDASDQPAFEAAVIDQLVKAGYDTTAPAPADGQIVELRIMRDTLVPEEAKRKPVSGAASVGVSNYGTSYGLAIGVDLTKPKKALVSTRLEARIKDRVSGATLWEGHASIGTREGDARWSDQAIATKLASALFGGFPRGATIVPSAG